MEEWKPCSHSIAIKLERISRTCKHFCLFLKHNHVFMSLKTLVFTLMLGLLSACQSSSTQTSKALYQHIGKQIREERLAQGLSQQQLADAVGMTQSSLSLIEDGLATPIHTKIIAIQEHLHMQFEFDGPYHTIEAYLEAARSASAEGK